MKLEKLFEEVIREGVDAIGYDENGTLKTTRHEGSIEDAIKGANVLDADDDRCEKAYQIFKKACEEVAQFVDIDPDDLNEHIGQYFADRDIFYYG